MKMELIDGSETSTISIVTPGNYPKENILHTEHGESLKSRVLTTLGNTNRLTRGCHGGHYNIRHEDVLSALERHERSTYTYTDNRDTTQQNSTLAKRYHGPKVQE